MSEPSRGRVKKVLAPRGRGRKSQAEREQLSQAERERTRARDADYAREQAKAAAEKRRRENEKSRAQRRGRGGYMGESRPAASAGPFSAGSVFQTDAKVGQAFPRPWASSKRSSTSKVKREEGGDPESSKTDHTFSQIPGDGIRTKHQDKGVISSEDDEHQGSRINVAFINMVSDEDFDVPPALRPVRIRRIEHKDRAPPVTAEEEELQERERRQNQIDILKAELGGVRLESRELLQDEKLDQIYIFQFPPKLPDLINPSLNAEDEPDSPPTLPTNQPQAGGTSATPASSSTQNSVPIKIEDDAPTSRTTTFSNPRSAHLPTLNPGLVGKLKIHDSGNVILDWGGTRLHLNKAIDASFLQDVIMVRPATQQSAGVRSEVGGEALAFGQVRGKFAVAPDWEGMC